MRVKTADLVGVGAEEAAGSGVDETAGVEEAAGAEPAGRGQRQRPRWLQHSTKEWPPSRPIYIP